MKAKLLYYWNTLQSTFWFVPLLIILGSIVLSTMLVFFDYRIGYIPEGWENYFFSNSSDSARTILSTIAGAMITVAGTVFSITLVALTIASSQFGSRLLRNFMHDRLNQIVLGVYISTFVYCLLVLNTIGNSDDFEFTPTLSVLLAIAVAILNIFLLIFFIHHIAVTIQTDKVVSDITNRLNKVIKDELTGEYNYLDEFKQSDAKEEYDKYLLSKAVDTRSSGYIQTIDYNRLRSIAARENILVSLKHKQGDFLPEAFPLLYIHSHILIEEEIKDEILDAFIFGKMRSSIQNPEFLIHQIVEMASRALSPGINDPFTAIGCIDNLSSSMSMAAQRNNPQIAYRDESDNVRIIVKINDFEGIVASSFNTIRHYAVGNPSVLLRLMEGLVQIHHFTVNTPRDEIIKYHADMVYRAAKQSFEEKNDLRDMKERYDNILR